MIEPQKELDEVWNEAFAEGYGEGYAELRQLVSKAAELLDGARCAFTDPSLRMAWGRQRKAFLDHARDLTEVRPA